jgi:phosphomannomutase
MLKSGHAELLPARSDARIAYIQRYLDFFTANTLAGMRVIVYQHSAVGRDILVEILRGLGGEVFPAGRSEDFVPIDTENIDGERLAAIQAITDEEIAKHGAVDAVASTDGDSDRPLLLGIEPDTRRVRFFGGDLLGMAVAEYLEADAVVVPITCNDGIDRGPLSTVLEPKTRIGSPYVIAGMTAAIKKKKRCVCGWEANGGFLVGSEIKRGGRILQPLPTRDAMLPLLSVLSSAREKNLGLCEFFERLPKRYSRAGILKDFPRSRALAIMRLFTPAAAATVSFAEESIQAIDVHGNSIKTPEFESELLAIRTRLSALFPSTAGFGRLSTINYLDGVRITFDDGEVVHLRPSGNADELRIYAVADDAHRAEQLIAMGVAEPDGILRQMEKLVL